MNGAHLESQFADVPYKDQNVSVFVPKYASISLQPYLPSSPTSGWAERMVSTWRRSVTLTSGSIIFSSAAMSVVLTMATHLDLDD